MRDAGFLVTASYICFDCGGGRGVYNLPNEYWPVKCANCGEAKPTTLSVTMEEKEQPHD